MGASSGGFTMLLPIVLLIVIMYFLLIRPQKKRERQVNSMRSSLKVGDQIITIGGICGRISKLKDDRMVLDIGADKVRLEIMRWAVSKVEVSAAETKRPQTEETEDAAEEEAPEAAPKKLPRKIGVKKPEAAEPFSDETNEPLEK